MWIISNNSKRKYFNYVDEEGVTRNRNILKIQPSTYSIKLLYFSSYHKMALLAQEKVKGQVNLISLVTKTKKKLKNLTSSPFILISFIQ